MKADQGEILGEMQKYKKKMKRLKFRYKGREHLHNRGGEDDDSTEEKLNHIRRVIKEETVKYKSKVKGNKDIKVKKETIKAVKEKAKKEKVSIGKSDKSSKFVLIKEDL